MKNLFKLFIVVGLVVVMSQMVLANFLQYNVGMRNNYDGSYYTNGNCCMMKYDLVPPMPLGFRRFGDISTISYYHSRMSGLTYSYGSNYYHTDNLYDGMMGSVYNY